MSDIQPLHFPDCDYNGFTFPDLFSGKSAYEVMRIVAVWGDIDLDKPDAGKRIFVGAATGYYLDNQATRKRALSDLSVFEQRHDCPTKASFKELPYTVLALASAIMLSQ